MTRRPGTLPLSELKHHQIRPHHTPDRVAQHGTFYIRDGWLRASLAEGHGGSQDVCFLIDYVKVLDGDLSVQFALKWSPLREKIVELVLRSGMPIGPCLLIRKPFSDTVNVWVMIGVEDDGTAYDPLSEVPAPEHPNPNAPVV